MASLRDPAARRAAGAVAVVSLLFVLVVLLGLVGRPLATDDLWWHLKLGEVYASQGPFVAEDPLYHTTRNHPTVPHEWLYQVGLHHLKGLFGFQGLRIAHGLAVAGLVVWALRIFRRASGGWVPAALAGIVFVELSWYRLFQLRPDLVSLAALFAIYALLLEHERPPGRVRSLGAALVFLLWVNMHSLFAIGLGLLVVAVMGVALRRLLARLLGGETDAECARRDRRFGMGLAAALVVCGLVTLLNPRGLAAHGLFFVEAASGDIWQLKDDFLPWNPLWPPEGRRALTPLSWLVADALLLAFAATATLGFLRLLRERSRGALADLDTVGLGLGTASLAAMFVAVRFHWLALFPLVYVLRALRRRGERAPGFADSVAPISAAACLLLALAFPGGIRLDSYAREVAAEPDGYRSPYLDQRYCGAGTRFLAEAGIEGKLFHPFNLGGFLGYWLSPGLRTFIDGRMDHYPSEVLLDYLKIRHASRAGAPRVLADLLDKWDIDVFFGTSFAETRYRDRHWISHMRWLPGWVPVFASQTHSIYLHRTPKNQRNFALARAYYLQRRIPFDTEKGVDVAAAIRRRPAWAVKQGLVPPHYDRLLEERKSADPERRQRALGELGRIYWQIGAFEEQVATDRELLLRAPDAKEPQRRLADGLLHLKRPSEALDVARRLHAADPGYEDIEIILAIARQRAEAAERRKGSPPAGPPEA